MFRTAIIATTLGLAIGVPSFALAANAPQSDNLPSHVTVTEEDFAPLGPETAALAFITSVRQAPNVDLSDQSDEALQDRRVVTCEGMRTGWYDYAGMVGFHVRSGFSRQEARVITVAAVLSTCPELGAQIPRA